MGQILPLLVAGGRGEGCPPRLSLMAAQGFGTTQEPQDRGVGPLGTAGGCGKEPGPGVTLLGALTDTDPAVEMQLQRLQKAGNGPLTFSHNPSLCRRRMGSVPRCHLSARFQIHATGGIGCYDEPRIPDLCPPAPLCQEDLGGRSHLQLISWPRAERKGAGLAV